MRDSRVRRNNDKEEVETPTSPARSNADCLVPLNTITKEKWPPETLADFGTVEIREDADYCDNDNLQWLRSPILAGLGAGDYSRHFAIVRRRVFSTTFATVHVASPLKTVRQSNLIPWPQMFVKMAMAKVATFSAVFIDTVGPILLCAISSNQ
jgi:hypothetical protein